MRRAPFLVFLLSLSVFLGAQDWIHYIPEPDESHFVLVIDRSGSMSGEAMEDARQAAIRFVQQIRPGDQVAIISFETRVHYDLAFTDDQQQLIRTIQGLETEGTTALYDGLAKAIQILKNRDGSRAILFLTDGMDNESSFRLNDIAQMNVTEAIQCYGIGLGNLDHDSIRRITRAARGEYIATDSSKDLIRLYEEIQGRHYAQDLSGTGSLSITSVPSGVPVLSQGEMLGTTPLMIPRQDPRFMDIELQFDKKSWQNDVEIREGFRGVVRAREDSLMPDLVIETAPLNSAVFIDDTYVGLSSMFPSQGNDRSNQLLIENLSPGIHQIRIVAVPDADLSASQEFEFELDLRDMTAYMNVNVFLKRANLFYNDGRRDTIQGNRMGDIQDSLNRFDSFFNN